MKFVPGKLYKVKEAEDLSNASAFYLDCYHGAVCLCISDKKYSGLLIMPDNELAIVLETECNEYD